MSNVENAVGAGMSAQERSDFEAWAVCRGLGISRNGGNSPYDYYLITETGYAWLAWQAARQRSPADAKDADLSVQLALEQADRKTDWCDASKILAAEVRRLRAITKSKETPNE